jgi:hypothetical protein
MIKNKTNEAYKVFSRIAKSNKKNNLAELQTLIPNTQSQISKKDLPKLKKNSSYIKAIKSVVKSRKLLLTTLVLLLNWFTLTAGLSLKFSNLKSSDKILPT